MPALANKPPFSIQEFTSIWRTWINNFWRRFNKYAVTFTPSSVGAGTTSEQTFTVTGLKAQSFVMVNKPTHQSGLGIVNCRVSANDTLAITYMNVSGGSITPTSEEYRIIEIVL